MPPKTAMPRAEARLCKRSSDQERVCREHGQARGRDLPAENDGIGPVSEKIKYVHKSSDQATEPDRPLRAVSPGVEDAYMRGEPLTPPEIEFSEYSDMEDDYWAWHQEDQVFRHWDEDLGDWLSFPERFD
ncbi:unnamed protein product [Fusarium graminearum]|uniref:Uncharacterized protein n=1 Tax=Gibberella zeae (strain ATCC MYA-4620 / CBS 123657 / FGSC 9075 / NRRL 31084 / PH-1) TaxID=229533 RepID=I1RYP3_GIBZE|nr:hypothetical protein FGSG_09501 [Fusarium graminearum PH-1]ESU16098.1 hypothetical protein FGSG_09501 [Fusarium graminearum PH-1]EYB31144.1 hypothetical protein FG05_09501 [Fusarium graminearum]KAI6769034.1 hypothetical protein HG531_010138 [Fusarium graminearum]CZS74379.1 unnamed protein product [Fusarium graminearum]|eukprot:XP_011328218.1 hypothetical protein FGSG_09501 [Fusarium graminearum PH-1]